MCEGCPLGQGGDCSNNACVWCPADRELDVTPLNDKCPAARSFRSDASQPDQLVCPDVWIELQNLDAIAGKQQLEISADATETGSLDEATCLATTIGYDIMRPDGSGGWQTLNSRVGSGVFGATGCSFNVADILPTSTLPTAPDDQLRVRIRPPTGGSSATHTVLSVVTDIEFCGPL